MATDELGLVIGIEVKDAPAVNSIGRISKGLDNLEKTASNTKKTLVDTGNSSVNSLDKLESKVGFLTKSFVSLGTTIGLAFLTHGIENTLSKFEDVSNAAKGLNTDFRGLKTLEQVFSLGEGNSQDVTLLLSKFNKSLSELKSNGDTAQNSFKRLGLTFKDFDGLQSDQSLIKILDSISKLSSETDKVSVSSDLFGRNYTQAMRLAKAGVVDLAASVKESGKVLSEEQVVGLEKAAKAQKELTASWDLAKLKITGDLAPALEGLIGILDRLAKSSAFSFKLPRELAASVLSAVQSPQTKPSGADITRANFGLDPNNDIYNKGVPNVEGIDFGVSTYTYNEKRKRMSAVSANYGLGGTYDDNEVHTGTFKIPKLPENGLPTLTNPADKISAGTAKALDNLNLFGNSLGISKTALEELQKSAKDLAHRGFLEALSSITKMKNKIDDYFFAKDDKKANEQLDKIFKSVNEKDNGPASFQEDRFNKLAADTIEKQRALEKENNPYNTQGNLDIYKNTLELQSFIDAQKSLGKDVSSWEKVLKETQKFTNNTPDQIMQQQKVAVSISVEPNENFWIKWSTDDKVVDGFTNLMSNIAANAASAGSK